MMKATAEEQNFLVSIFQDRKKKNSKYSLRAFARDLKVPASRLSEILNGKRKISKKMKLHFAEHLDLSPEMAREKFDLQTHDPKVEGSVRYTYAEIKEDTLAIVVDWYHFAILNLIDTQDFESSPQWIAKRLGIEKQTAVLALQRLQRVGLIVLVDREYKKTKNNLSTSDQITSQALKAAHRQVLDRTVNALDKIPVTLRDISSVSMAIDLKNLNLAKLEIKRFRRRLARLMETGERTEVYNLNVQFVPVTKVRELI
jgi:uncharacterized protein (TIGR02147 family)